MLKVFLFVCLIGLTVDQVKCEPCVVADDCLMKFYKEARSATDQESLCYYLNEALLCLEESKLKCEFSQNAWINHKIEDLHRNHPTCGSSTFVTPYLVLVVLFLTQQFLS